jgi:hypothetical protein
MVEEQAHQEDVKLSSDFVVKSPSPPPMGPNAVTSYPLSSCFDQERP